MALSGSLGFTNVTSAVADVTPTKIDYATDYAVTTDDPQKVVMKNITSPIDQIETITYQSQELNVINQEEKNANPPKVAGGRLITVKVEDKMRVTSTSDDTFIVDYPCSCSISFRFSKTQYITAATLETLLKRAIGALQDPSDASFRLDELMMLQLNPTN